MTEKLIAPPIFKDVVNFPMFDTPVTVNFCYPVTIIRIFDYDHNIGDEMMKKIEVEFDTVAFPQCMMKQARFYVCKVAFLSSGIDNLSAKGYLRLSRCP